MNWTLKKLAKKIYLLNFDNGYDLALHFLRLQEYYESPNDNFRGKHFTIIDFMEWYSKEQGDNFTYATDWAGFNLPSRVFADLYATPIKDWNKYDDFMSRIYNLISAEEKEFCLIGALEWDEETIDHELAHAFYATKPEYKNDLVMITGAPTFQPIYNAVSSYLLTDGYTEEVIDDEFQAYMATGFTEGLLEHIKQEGIKQEHLDKHMKEYSEVFKRYKEKLEG